MNIENYRFQASPEVIFTTLDENNATLMDLNMKLSYVLNKTGQKIWCLLIEGCTINEILERLHKDFDVEHEQARKSVINFIEELLLYKLIYLSEINEAGRYAYISMHKQLQKKVF